MTTDRRQQVLRLYHLALARDVDDRSGFLDDACDTDEALRREVDILLAHDPPEDFLESAALKAVAALPFGDPGVLIGRRIGAYRIESRLGSGGMGDVYRATDTTLGREVAIKMLPAAFAFDPERRARLDREAKALASLNHPNIAHVYGLETTGGGAGLEGGGVIALVMELVDGETLTQVLQRGPLPIDDALRYGAQIADALAAAHTQGIVHRDVKPANVMIGKSGLKVLDFGIAKRSEPPHDDVRTALSGGEATTGPHAILGTVAYMSPEQAEGKPVDARSDVFSLGVVLYEMLCGQRPFAGDTVLASLAATLKSAPLRPRTFRKEIPADVERIVLRCLEKKPEARYGSAREVHLALTAGQASRSIGSTRQRAALIGAALVVLVGAVGLGAWSYVRGSRARWVEEEAVPQASRLINENRRLAAAAVYRRAERYAPTSRGLLALADAVAAQPVSFATAPEGARIYLSDYVDAAGDDLADWQLLGQTPLTANDLPRWGYYRVRAVKEGFSTAERTHFTGPGRAKTVEIALRAQGDVPSAMVWVPPTEATIPVPLVGQPAKLPGFWMDRFEVTNRLFKAFVDAGGYEKEEYWTEPFVRDGRTLTWREAMNGFRDATRRPGPSSWQLGTYPEGADDLPVGGVSWYEAAAYAAFAGKRLPTLHEWWTAAIEAPNSDVLTLSNFGTGGPVPVAARRAMSRFGTYDMAGNVKEWVTNSSNDGRRYLLGGAWKEEPYVFTVPEPRSPLSRDDTFGFRCVRRVSAPPDDTFGSFARAAPSVRGAPVDDVSFQRIVSLYAYDKASLIATVERVDDASPHWRRETLWLQPADGSERVLVHLFLPKNATAPYHIVVLAGSSAIHAVPRIEDLDGPFQFLLRAGRAVMVPVFTGTLERGPSPMLLPPNQERMRALKWSVELGRSIDYLENRPDIDTATLAFYGVSLGAAYGARLIAVEHRFKAAVLLSGGLGRPQPPEVDALNFAPRVRVPVLMMNGRDDFMVPYSNQQMLFDALGSKDKVFKRYEGGHANLLTRPDLIGEVLDWLDKHLGPVD